MPALPCPDPLSLHWWRSVDPATLTVPLTDRLKAALVATISSLAPPADETLMSRCTQFSSVWEGKIPHPQ
jgi:hypothetical protein